MIPHKVSSSCSSTDLPMNTEEAAEASSRAIITQKENHRGLSPISQHLGASTQAFRPSRPIKAKVVQGFVLRNQDNPKYTGGQL
eukprot:23777-Eustigmatos_ZCMA.PRE.1